MTKKILIKIKIKKTQCNKRNLQIKLTQIKRVNNLRMKMIHLRIKKFPSNNKKNMSNNKRRVFKSQKLLLHLKNQNYKM